MKLRNFIIVLLAVLMAFAFASCKNDPEPTPPGPTPPGPTGDVYQFQVTQGIDVEHKAYSYDKLKLVWEEEVNEGDTLSLKYRSERGIYQWDIRDAYKWVYETHKNGFVDPVLGEDGWYTLTYTFPATDYQGAEVEYPQTSFGVFFRGWFLTGDLFEIKDVTINGQALDAPKITSSGQLNDPAVEHDWTKKDCAVMFFLTDGDVAPEGGVVKLSAGATLQEKDLPKQEGSVLKLYTDAAHTTEFVLTTPINEDTRIFYEFVSNTHTVHFNTNGGSPEIPDQTVNDGSPITVPENPTKIGAEFAAWCTDEELTKEWNVTAPVVSDMTLYAKYTPLVVYTVKFNTNGGLPEIPDQTVNNGSPITVPENPSKIGAEFAAWCTDEELTKEWNVTDPVTSDMTLYAKYTPLAVYTVKFNTNGGSPATIEDQKVFAGSAIVAPDNPTKEGKLFKAWCTDEELTKEWNVTDPVTSDMTLYAAYDDAVKVTFKSNGGEFPDGKENLEVTIVKGTAVEKPTDPAKKDVYFAGWFTDEALTKAYDFATLVNADLPLYAKWSLGATVTLVNYDMEGGSTTLDVAIGKPMDEEAANAKLVDPPHGYSFGGWYDDANYKFEHEFEADVEESFTIYAQWIEPTLYHLEAIHSDSEDLYSYDKLAVYYKNDGPRVNDGDKLTFRFRTTKPFTFFSVRGDKKWTYQNDDAENNYGFDSFETKEDGWTYVTFTFNSAKPPAYDSGVPSSNAWFELHFGNRDDGSHVGIEQGDILEIQCWEINGEPVEIKASNVSRYAGATFTIIEGGEYEWTDHTVHFETNGGSEIKDATVEYGQRVAKPEDPVKAGVLFAGWYSDSDLTMPFDFIKTRITEDTTLYAKYGEPVTVSFVDPADDSVIKSVDVPYGSTVDRPAKDPVKEGTLFGGWYANKACTIEFDFEKYTFEDDTKIYAKFLDVWTVTLNMNYGDKPETKTVYAPKDTGVIPADDMRVGRPGYFLDGWFDAAEGGKEVEKVTADCTIYAHWTAPENFYSYTAKESEKEGQPVVQYDRWQFRWKSTSVSALENLAPGDVITFVVKFGTDGGGTAPATCRIRTANDSSEKSLNLTGISLTPAEDGWVYITCSIPEGTEIQGKGLLLTMDGVVKVGDTCKIYGVSYNGLEVPITTDSTSCGLYPGAVADVEVIPFPG
jgi:uncharacterized repeat protein (TIGR02543 family)